MKEYRTEDIRNIALVGHGGTGKTSFAEAALFVSGAISRIGRVEDGTTTSDYDPDEAKRKISINLSLLPCEWKGKKLNLIDTPGYADFVGEVKAGLRAADAALLVVDASSGVEVGTEMSWSYIDERDLPRLILVNRMDRENADFFQALNQIQSFFGKQCVPLQLPIGRQSSFEGVVDLLTRKSYSGEKAAEAAAPDSLAGEVEKYREQLVEAIAEADDELLNKYLEGEELSEEELSRGLRAGVIKKTIVPVLVGASLKNIGTQRVLEAAVEYLPSPVDAGTIVAKNAGSGEQQELEADAAGPLAALVFKTTADPYVGKLTYLRVYSGTLKADSQAWNANKSTAERIAQLFTVRGKNQEPTPQLTAGDIGALSKLGETSTNDTLCNRELPLILPPIGFPPPAFSAAVYPRTKADLDKMGSALARIVEEDPTLHVHRDQSTGETVLSGLGEPHLDVAVEKVQRKFGVGLELTTPKVPYRETITTTSSSEYTHKKQTGGHGQYARVAIRLEPLPRGSGFEFADAIVGGVVPKTYIPAVEKGVTEAMNEGVLAHYPLVDTKVTLYDGKDHPVDSSEMAFKIAGAMALKQGALQARPILIEPIMNLRVVVPEANTGDVMGDLNSKRAKVLGITPEDGSSVIDAQVPLAEVQRYATDLRSITQGRGRYSLEFSHYEEVPAHLAQKIIEKAKEEAKSS
ncbi:MAG: elongation factor G [Dehalococcoidia bacterium]|nr:elongation factor G [Dehalococcoidia bacterium]